MKKLLIVLVIVLTLASVAQAVPYPYRDYTLDTTGDLDAIYKSIQGQYTVYARKEGDRFYPWSGQSTARLQAAETIEAQANRDANLQFWTPKEKSENISSSLRTWVDNSLSFSITLHADKNASEGWHYAEIGGYSSYVDRVVLETSDGKVYTPSRIGDPSSSLYGTGWVGFNFVFFPRYVDGVQIISEDTEWIKLWVISGSNRLYFRFDFEH